MDALLLAMVVIWAGNYSLVKVILREVPPLPFNAVRLAVAAAVFLALIAWSRLTGSPQARPSIVSASSRVTGRDWLILCGLGLVGHFVYQFGFIGGLARTSVANSALIIGCSPVAIAMMTVLVGHERIGRLHWLGAALSVGGLSLVAGRGAEASRETLAGDLMMLGAVCCWAVYTVFSRPLLARHSPLVVTGWSMVFGALMFVPATLRETLRVDWARVSAGAWMGTALSAVLALNVAYLIWYTSVQRVGNARTSVYSNVVPVAAMVMAWGLLGERIAWTKWAGAAAIVSGVVLTRFSRSGPRLAPPDPPAEE
jgi:drug/metabolite transporter (DMT)-like permease